MQNIFREGEKALAEMSEIMSRHSLTGAAERKLKNDVLSTVGCLGKLIKLLGNEIASNILLKKTKIYTPGGE